MVLVFCWEAVPLDIIAHDLVYITHCAHDEKAVERMHSISTCQRLLGKIFSYFFGRSTI